MKDQHRRQESNLRASGSEPDARPTVATPEYLFVVAARAEGVEPSYHCFKGSWLTVSRHPNIVHQTECHVGVEPT